MYTFGEGWNGFLPSRMKVVTYCHDIEMKDILNWNKTGTYRGFPQCFDSFSSSSVNPIDVQHFIQNKFGSKILRVTHPLIFARFYWLFTSCGAKSPDCYHATTLAASNFSTNIPVEEEQEQEANGDKPAQEFLFFCPSHFMWKKNEPVL